MITSPANARMKAVIHMQQKAKARREADAFLTEGVKMFLEAPIERILFLFWQRKGSCCLGKIEEGAA